MAKKHQHAKSKHSHGRWKGVRAFWSGTISFALVNVPVHLFPANRSGGFSLRMLDEDGTPLVRRYYCPEENRDIPSEHIVRGYELEDHQYVLIRDDELEALEPEKSREIDLRRFVNLADISPLYYDRAYYLTPAGDSNKAYRLLAAVMEETQKAGIATFVMRDREYLIAILAQGGILRAQTMRFPDELRTPATLGLPEATEPSTKEVNRLAKKIRSLHVDQLDTDLLKDKSLEKLHQLVERKRKRKKEVVRLTKKSQQEAKEDESAPDLLESIRRSLHHENGSSTNGHHSHDGQLDEKNKEELYEEAQRLDIPGRSKLNKEELIEAIRHSRG